MSIWHNERNVYYRKGDQNITCLICNVFVYIIYECDSNLVYGRQVLSRQELLVCFQPAGIVKESLFPQPHARQACQVILCICMQEGERERECVCVCMRVCVCVLVSPMFVYWDICYNVTAPRVSI